jgi:hypothetical protein
MTWASVGKVTGMLLAVFCIAIVLTILRHAFGVERMEDLYETLALLAATIGLWWLIWGRQP